MTKKIITISIIVLLAIGFGWYLFSISGGPQNGTIDNFDLSNLDETSMPAPVTAEDHVLGNPDAKNTIIIYEDLQCPACKNYEPILRAFPTSLEDTKVVFRHFPLISIHRNATAGAYAAEAAGAQGKFWEWVALAYERQERWQGERDPNESFVQIAQDIGISDLEKFRADLENKTFRSKVQRDVRDATSIKVRGTPSLFYNGIKLNVTGLDGIKQQVEAIESSK